MILLLAACVRDVRDTGGDTAAAVPDIEVTPASVDFGDGYYPGVTGIESVTVSNLGADGLEIHNVTVDDPEQPFVLSGITSVLLPYGMSASFTITYEPIAAEDNATVIRIDTNDPDEPQVVIPVSGSASSGELFVTGDTGDFGTVYLGCEREQTFTIASHTGEAQEIDPVLSGSGAFRVVEPVVPRTLEPGESVDVVVRYAPSGEGDDAAALTIGTTEIALSGSAVLYGTNVDTFTQSLVDRMDVVFAVDSSAGMSRYRDALVGEFDTFFDTLDAAGADYQVSVVTADDGCVAGDSLYLAPGMSPDDRDATFAAWFDVTDTGRYKESGFTVLEAATSSTNLDGCNAGLIRDDARLHLVGFTDEVEQSANPWSYYVTLFQMLKADPDDVVIHAIAGDYPAGCDDSEPGQGWYEASVATGGVFLSVCGDPEDNLEILAEALLPAHDTFSLSAWPVPETIVVRVDGVEVTPWVYREDQRAIVFDVPPPDGANIEVEYTLFGDCEG